MVFVKNVLLISSLFHIYVFAIDHSIPINWSPSFFQGKYKLSQNIQYFIEEFKPVLEKKKIIDLFNKAINSFPTKDERDFFIHTLNITMATNMKTLPEVERFIEETKTLVKQDHSFPKNEKTLLDRFAGIFTEKSMDELFHEALAGNKDALAKIKEKAAALKNLSQDQKQAVLKKLEKVTLDMLTKTDVTIHQAMVGKYKIEQEEIESRFNIVSEKLDHSSKEYKDAEMKKEQDLEDIMHKEMAATLQAKTSRDSHTYIILKNCHDILFALEPMLTTKYQHMMFTYDRTNNNALLNLLDFKDFDLSNIKTTEELETMIQKEVAALVKDKKIDIPVHRETKSKFHSLVKDEILEHHPDLVLPAQRTSQNMAIADKEGDSEYKDEIMINHHASIQAKPYWQKDQINRNLNRYLLENEKLSQRLHNENREAHSLL